MIRGSHEHAYPTPQGRPLAINTVAIQESILIIFQISERFISREIACEWKKY